MNELTVTARRALAVAGGALSGIATGASLPSFVTASYGQGLTVGGHAAGTGVGLMAAALVRE